MERLANLQELTNRAQQPTEQEQQEQPPAAVIHPSDDATEPQRTLDDVVNKRLQQLEEIQERQLEWQVKTQHLCGLVGGVGGDAQSGSHQGLLPPTSFHRFVYCGYICNQWVRMSHPFLFTQQYPKPHSVQ